MCECIYLTKSVCDYLLYFPKVDDVDSVPVHSLKKHFHIIQERVNYNQLLPQLYQDRVLSIEEEIAKIESQPSQAAKTMHLVHMLEKKGKTGVKSFVESLLKDEHNLGHIDLAQELMSGMCTY